MRGGPGNRICAGEIDRVRYDSQQEPGKRSFLAIIGRSARPPDNTSPSGERQRGKTSGDADEVSSGDRQDLGLASAKSTG